ncbi:LysR family transcriptional regulator [Neopusillimonas maritima]|uniref:LysR family transcriptional regulator n=1 Tax=Neopusillimonas maritima TaxID=2026239 RepID=A0A3A1YU11_9BURK|nr:LysR family transcriptional regulator [Neopusillimonas maritima]RIY40360.1 LysR family transcriptional regulator [Neopusillimonas maritima]
MSRLNYHHLYYFWRVATDGNLTRVAKALHVSQSALSAQIRQLEESMEVTLFDRRGRGLTLTEAGQRVLAYAQDIFAKGEELEALLRRGVEPSVQTLRIGVLSTMSRNFVKALVAPLLQNASVRMNLYSADLVSLLDGMTKHRLDLVLSNVNVVSDNHLDAAQQQLWQSQLLARQPVSIVGPARDKPNQGFPEGYREKAWILPGRSSDIRTAFDGFCAMWNLDPVVRAEADDMAMLRLLTRDSGALSVLPPVVVRDEIEQGTLVEYLPLPNVFESFYAITVKRQFMPEALASLLARPALDVLVPVPGHD